VGSSRRASPWARKKPRLRVAPEIKAILCIRLSLSMLTRVNGENQRRKGQLEHFPSGTRYEGGEAGQVEIDCAPTATSSWRLWSRVSPGGRWNRCPSARFVESGQIARTVSSRPRAQLTIDPGVPALRCWVGSRRDVAIPWRFTVLYLAVSRVAEPGLPCLRGKRPNTKNLVG
jgi:hypothetical protein